MIYVVIPVHNRKNITACLLETLTCQTSNEYIIVVVDDGSKDGTSEMISNRFPEVILLHGDGNLWWTGATNLGLSYVIDNASEHDYAMLLNDDLVVADEFIECANQLTGKFPGTLIQAVEMDVDDQDVILNGGWRINWTTAKYSQLNVGKCVQDYPSGYTEEVSTQTGRGTLIPVGAFKELGLYNSGHYPQCGDFEFPVRANRNGYKLIMHYDLRIYSSSEETCEINISQTYKFSDIASYFFEMRSYAYLPSRFWFAYDTSRNLLQGTIFLVFDLFRVTSHFFRKLRI